MIRVTDMLKKMNEWESSVSHVPFSITFVKCNIKANTGGEKITLDRAVMVGGGKSKSESRNPNHFDNYTRNIRSAEGDRIMKLHVLHITRFNGMSIIL